MFENGKWQIQQISDWKGRHIFKGGGSGPSKFGTSLWLGSVKPYEAGKMGLPYGHWKYGRGLLLFDEETLKPLGSVKGPKTKVALPAEINKLQSDFPEMRRIKRKSSGPGVPKGVDYFLCWENLPPNRDRPREGKLPENSDLVLYTVVYPETTD